MDLYNKNQIYFPNLKDEDYRITSPIDIRYNCIAFAAEDQNNFWWPDRGFWPHGVSREVNLHSFIDAFQTLGYKRCRSIHYISFYDKVVIYVDSQGNPTHMARQEKNGIWVSKLGSAEDIQHFSLSCIGGQNTLYGIPKQVLRRRNKNKFNIFGFLLNFIHEYIFSFFIKNL